MTQRSNALALAPTRTQRLRDERLFQLLFLLSFPIFLAMALGARVLPGAKSDDGNGDRNSNLLSEAAAAARSTIAIALTD